MKIVITVKDTDNVIGLKEDIAMRLEGVADIVRIDTADVAPKSEVASEIFAEIYERLLLSFPAQSFIDAPCTTHDRLFNMVAELKKKYTEDKR